MATVSKSGPRVSVVMPARNAGATLEAAIDSIRQQTFADLDIVLVDHKSSDDSLEIMENAATQDQRVRVFRESGTFVNAANLAWREGRGELIARMDSDDIAYPERISAQVDFLSENLDIAACGTLVNIVKSSGTVEGGYQRYEQWVNSVIEPNDIISQRFVDSPLPNPTTMVRRCVMEDLRGYSDPPWAEDYDFWLRLLESGHRLGKIDRVLLDWYDEPTRATRTRERYSLSRFQEAKAFYLSRMEIVRRLGVIVCGAGPIGKEMAGFLGNHDITVNAFVEVNVRQIGNRIGGAPVLPPSELVTWKSRAVALGAVGQTGAREKLSELARTAGFTEGVDFFSVA